MKVCEECNTSRSKVSYSKEFKKLLCGNCLNVYKNHKVNSIPEIGEVAYDEEGRVICHICGRAFNKVLSHARQRHNISAKEYKKKFGLDLNKGLTSKSTKEALRKSVLKNYDKVVEENLIKNGEKTRFKEGHEGRTADKVSIQTKKRFKERGK